MPMLPPGTFADKVAFITGGGTGLGVAMGQELAALGARIVVASRKAENLENARRSVAGEVLPLQLDVRQPEQVAAAVQQAVEQFGGIDLLVNNAAGNFVCAAEDLSVNGWNAVVGTVLNGTFYVTREVGKHMIARGRGGSILNIIATYAEDAGPGVCHSAAAKAGVLSLTRTLAVEWARHKIRVNALAPGPIEGTGAAPQLWPTEEGLRRVIADVPLGRIGRPEEVAHAAVYILSDYAAFMTGANVVLDGGQWLSKGHFQPPGRG
jgi:NAD(P)-dependent dehydrogenase (short-subunit alcohol dehydrogenase family)